MVFGFFTIRLFHNSDIIELAAFEGGKKEFKIYIFPSQELTKKASEFTGLKYDIKSGERVVWRTRNIMH